MATTLYLRGRGVTPPPLLWTAGTTPGGWTLGDTGRGVTPGDRLLDGMDQVSGLNTTIGNNQLAVIITTVAGPTAGITPLLGSFPALWFSLPLAADVTISGTITWNLCGQEANMSANAGLRPVLYRLDGTGALTAISTGTTSAELPVAADGRLTFTATPTSTNMKIGDRFMLTVLFDDTTTMGAGFQASMSYDGANATFLDSNVQFTETITFITADPTGTQYFLRNVASDINPGAGVEYALNTTNGAASNTAAHTSVAGPVAWPGDQWTETGGGATIEWYTPTLNAFTLSGVVKLSLTATSSVLSHYDVTPFDAFVVELAVVDPDGSSAVVWSQTYNQHTASVASGTARTIYLSGPSLAVAQGQRLRLRFYQDDFLPGGNAAAGTTVTLRFGGAAGFSTSLIFTQTITEGAPPATKGFPFSPANQRRIVALI